MGNIPEGKVGLTYTIQSMWYITLREKEGKNLTPLYTFNSLGALKNTRKFNTNLWLKHSTNYGNEETFSTWLKISIKSYR